MEVFDCGFCICMLQLVLSDLLRAQSSPGLSGKDLVSLSILEQSALKTLFWLRSSAASFNPQFA